MKPKNETMIFNSRNLKAHKEITFLDKIFYVPISYSAKEILEIIDGYLKGERDL